LKKEKKQDQGTKVFEADTKCTNFLVGFRILHVELPTLIGRLASLRAKS
jgi:hypothetical protein